MKNENRIKNYGIQNSTMDDVFLKITTDTSTTDELELRSDNTNTIGL